MPADNSSRLVGEDEDDKWVHADDLFSDESSFYGDEDAKTDLERRAADFDPKVYWDVVQWNIQCLAARAAEHRPQGSKRKRGDDTTSKTAPAGMAFPSNEPSGKNFTERVLGKMTTKLYNPFEGDHSARQLSEPPDSFLKRLPPSSTETSEVGPWIWVANPYSLYRPTSEDVAGFKQEASKALAEYTSHKNEYERQNPNKTSAGITRMLKPEREMLEEQIIELAKRFRVINGKWMLFPTSEDVDAVWSMVVRAVVNDELGCSAKVETNDGNPDKNRRLICIYTDNFADVEDVKRVLKRMQQLGFTKDKQGKTLTIYYKCDAYTHLEISNGNEYKLKASLYSSRDLSSEMPA